MEIWKPIPGFEGGYEASDQGRVRSLDRTIICEGVKKGRYASVKKGRLLKPGKASNGYPTVVLGRGHSRTVHSLIAETFIGPCPKGKEVRHKDGKRDNPRAANLEYGTRTENILDAVRHKTWMTLARTSHLKKVGFGGRRSAS